MGSADVKMANDCLIGLAISGGNDKGELASGMFENVAVERTPPTPPEKPEALTAVADGDRIKLSWTNRSADQSGVKIERSLDNELFYEIADPKDGVNQFLNTGLTAKPYYYRIRAYNTGGYSDYSNTAHATPLANSQREPREK